MKIEEGLVFISPEDDYSVVDEALWNSLGGYFRDKLGDNFDTWMHNVQNAHDSLVYPGPKKDLPLYQIPLSLFEEALVLYGVENINDDDTVKRLDGVLKIIDKIRPSA